MAENNDVPENVAGDKDQTSVDEAAVAAPEVPEAVADEPATVPAPAAAAGPRLRDRVFSFRSVVALGAATLLLGGAGGAALGAATSDNHNDQRRIGRFGPGAFDGNGNGPRFGPGGPGGPGGMRQYGQRNQQDGSGSQEAPPGPPGNPS